MAGSIDWRSDDEELDGDPRKRGTTVRAPSNELLSLVYAAFL